MPHAHKTAGVSFATIMKTNGSDFLVPRTKTRGRFKSLLANEHSFSSTFASLLSFTISDRCLPQPCRKQAFFLHTSLIHPRIQLRLALAEQKPISGLKPRNTKPGCVLPLLLDRLRLKGGEKIQGRADTEPKVPNQFNYSRPNRS